MSDRLLGRLAFGACATCAFLLVPLLAAGDGGAPGPRIRFGQTTHDFGTLTSQEIVRFSWPYRNEGNAPLVITGTKPSCGCTATAIDESPVAVGESGVLEVTFDPKGIRGTVRKSLAIMSNDPVHPRVLLTIRADVRIPEEPRAEGAHPPIEGQSLLMGECAGCHAAPASGKSGAELWGAVCAMCHGAEGEGVSAPALRDAAWLSANDDESIAQMITYGTANPGMPGFSALMGGPLSEGQIDSLVLLIRSWRSTPR